MRITLRLAGVGALTLAVATALAPTASAASHHPTAHHRGAVFVQTDNPAGNAIVAYDRTADGGLRQAGTYPTGGRGGVLSGSVVDHLASQGSLALDRAHHLLYAVNAGSNTVSVFSVNGDRLNRRQVISAGGDFPVSLAVSGRLLYVLNARSGGSIQGFVRVDDQLRRVPGWHRTLGLDPTATPEFTHTPGQIAFTPDGDQLVITTKAATNSVEVFNLHRHGAPAAAPVTNALPGAVPFAVTFDQGGHLVVAEAGTNSVATFTVTPTGRLKAIDQVATGQAATCWITRSGRYLYASNAGSATVSGYRDRGHAFLHALGNTGTDAGTVDAAASHDGRYLYVQAGAAGQVDSFRIARDGSLTRTGTVTVPDAVGAEGIVAS